MALSLARMAATHCNTLQHRGNDGIQQGTYGCNTLQHTATHYNTLQHIATHCDTLQHTEKRCSTLQHKGNDGI